jgi:antitoxin component YwqK of YwqJK toxin-antitoxin module
MSDEELLKLARKIKKYCKERHCVEGCTFAYYENGSKRPHCKLKNDKEDVTYPEDWQV